MLNYVIDISHHNNVASFQNVKANGIVGVFHKTMQSRPMIDAKYQARYSSQLPNVPPAWTIFTFWQYTDGNSGDQPHPVPGIGRCDRDKFNGSLDGLQKLWGVEKRQSFF